jgi:hypothetical protein
MTPDKPALPPVEIPPGPYRHEPGRRVRFAPNTDRELRVWLTRAARCHAHLCGVVRVYANPGKAGGGSLLGDGFAERIAGGDRSLLYDALGFCRDEIDALREEIAGVMETAPATTHLPGSREKVAVMMRRLETGYALFQPGDAATPLD